MLLPKPVGRETNTSFPSTYSVIISSCGGFSFVYPKYVVAYVTEESTSSLHHLAAIYIVLQGIALAGFVYRE